MLIHNVMEDIVYDQVNKVFDEAEKSHEKWLACSCIQCRLDIMCYVLNRIQPRYIKSIRGLSSFFQSELEERRQIKADIATVAVEGIKLISSSNRLHTEPYCDYDETHENIFNLPVINGKVLEGNTLIPMNDVKITLKSNGELVKQMGKQWENPYITTEKAAGAFTFWPRAIPAEKENESKAFQFLLIAEKAGYDTVKMMVDLTVNSEPDIGLGLDITNQHKLGNIYLFDSKKE